ncbi:Maf family protein [Hyphococcus flavus]|uniref:dTTP/UTP pyrophosphatase n=1 Tax=Hyphococcus flavus TaxID=1866326 RepID=A0AAE9ZB33_9PROT|nr:nucleoside triphosphate pyrophosphatase [Hyphococcus flavus]WDI31208.1 Maf family protein [Hyphococcus flavus]
MSAPPLILASQSPRRKALLELIGVTPDQIIPADIDEAELKGEKPEVYVTRLAREKALHVAGQNPHALVLGSDTAVAVGRRILPKTEDEQSARFCLELLSGRSHRVFSGVAVVKPGGDVMSRVCETRVKVRSLDRSAIDNYIASDEWRGKAGGYAIQGLFAKHIVQLIGSHSNVVGLPLYETYNLLTGAGWSK